MKEELLARMAEIVAEEGSSIEDFEKYTYPYMQNIEASDFPLLWLVCEWNSHCACIGAYRKKFVGYEQVRYDYVRNHNPFSYETDQFQYMARKHKKFLITEEGISEVTREQAIEVVRDTITPVVKQWIEQNGPLPKNTPIKINIQGIGLNELMELMRKDDTEGGTLRWCLNSLRYDRRAADERVDVNWLGGCGEFEFTHYINGEPRLYGHIVYHGNPKDGYMKNDSVQLNPQYGWSKHT